MLTLEEINKLLNLEAVEFSKHAHKRMLERNIKYDEIKECTSNVQILEHYDDDKYGPTCLLFGTTLKNRPLHIVVTKFLTLGSEKKRIKIISIYEPNPKEWDNFINRKK